MVPETARSETESGYGALAAACGSVGNVPGARPSYRRRISYGGGGSADGRARALGPREFAHAFGRIVGSVGRGTRTGEMKINDQRRALKAAEAAAREVGTLLRKNLRLSKRINSSEQHDIKLELDVRCQKLIEKRLRTAFPEFAVLGEEGVVGSPLSTDRWVVDPIDGTVNFTYGIPHACVSIALQHQTAEATAEDLKSNPDAAFETTLGVVYDPFTDEM